MEELAQYETATSTATTTATADRVPLTRREAHMLFFVYQAKQWAEQADGPRAEVVGFIADAVAGASDAEELRTESDAALADLDAAMLSLLTRASSIAETCISRTYVENSQWTLNEDGDNFGTAVERLTALAQQRGMGGQGPLFEACQLLNDQLTLLPKTGPWPDVEFDAQAARAHWQPTSNAEAQFDAYARKSEKWFADGSPRSEAWGQARDAVDQAHESDRAFVIKTVEETFNKLDESMEQLGLKATALLEEAIITSSDSLAGIHRFTELTERFDTAADRLGALVKKKSLGNLVRQNMLAAHSTLAEYSKNNLPTGSRSFPVEFTPSVDTSPAQAAAALDETPGSSYAGSQGRDPESEHQQSTVDPNGAITKELKKICAEYAAQIDLLRKIGAWIAPQLIEVKKEGRIARGRRALRERRDPEGATKRNESVAIQASLRTSLESNLTQLDAAKPSVTRKIKLKRDLDEFCRSLPKALVTQFQGLAASSFQCLVVSEVTRQMQKELAKVSTTIKGLHTRAEGLGERLQHS